MCVFLVGGIFGMFAFANLAAGGIPHALRFLHVKGSTRYGEVVGYVVLALGAELGGAGLMFLKSLFGALYKVKIRAECLRACSSVMQLGAEVVFVGSGIFMKNSTEFASPEEAEKRTRAIVRKTKHYNDPKVLLEVSSGVPSAMKGLAVSAMDEANMMQTRGW